MWLNLQGNNGTLFAESIVKDLPQVCTSLLAGIAPTECSTLEDDSVGKHTYSRHCYLVPRPPCIRFMI